MNQVSSGNGDGWMVAWCEWDHLVAVEDWDLFGALIDGNGVVRQTNRLDDALRLCHLRDPKVAGNQGEFLVTYGASPDLSTLTQVELRSRRFTWESHQLQSQMLAPYRTIAGPTSVYFPVRNGDLGNLALDVLGLPPIPKSELDYAQDLEVLTP